MKKVNENLSEIFDVEPIEEFQLEPPKKSITVIEQSTTNVVDTDTEFARNNIRGLIEKGNQAIDDLLLVANQSEHPRAYEVAAGLIKNLADLNKDLLEIQKRKRDLQPKEEQNKSVNIDKAVFVGSTAELIKLVRNK
jgi:hypothetical protein